MREYQVQGLQWLVRQYDHGINAILADEMVGDLKPVSSLHQVYRVTSNLIHSKDGFNHLVCLP